MLEKGFFGLFTDKMDARQALVMALKGGILLGQTARDAAAYVEDRLELYSRLPEGAATVFQVSFPHDFGSESEPDLEDIALEQELFTDGGALSAYPALGGGYMEAAPSASSISPFIPRALGNRLPTADDNEPYSERVHTYVAASKEIFRHMGPYLVQVKIGASKIGNVSIVTMNPSGRLEALDYELRDVTLLELHVNGKKVEPNEELVHAESRGWAVAAALMHNNDPATNKPFMGPSDYVYIRWMYSRELKHLGIDSSEIH